MTEKDIDTMETSNEVPYATVQVALIYFACFAVLAVIVACVYSLGIILSGEDFLIGVRRTVKLYLLSTHMRAFIFFDIFLVFMAIRFIAGPRSSLLKFEEKMLRIFPVLVCVFNPLLVVIAMTIIYPSIGDSVLIMPEMRLLWWVFALIFSLPIVVLLLSKELGSNIVFVITATLIVALMLLVLFLATASQYPIRFFISIIYAFTLETPLLYMKLSSRFLKERAYDVFLKIKSVKQIILVLSTLPMLYIIGAFANIIRYTTERSQIYDAISGILLYSCAIPIFLLYIFSVLLYHKTIKPIAIEEGYEL